MDIRRIAELANIKLERGRALVLVGPAGCGKTTFAEIIAAKNGCHHIATVSHIAMLTSSFLNASDVMILDDVEFSADVIAALKPYIASSEGGRPLHFIITTAVAPKLDADDRRFNVVALHSIASYEA